MAAPNKYPVKDLDGLPKGVFLTFQKKLKPELICCTCNAVTPKGRKDGNGHIFCPECLAVHTDKMNQFRCSLDGRLADIKDMSGNDKEWETLKQMKAACPNDKACPFTGSLQDVLRHYKTCRNQRKVKCPLCESLQDSRTLADHIRERCSRRLMNGRFCNEDVQACNKLVTTSAPGTGEEQEEDVEDEILHFRFRTGLECGPRKHESHCRQGPGRCEHCGSFFKTFAELEDQHIPKCPVVPVHCSFKSLGCTFYGARRLLTAHESSGEHTVLLVREVLLVKEENKILRESLQAQEKKHEKRVGKLQEELGHVKQHCSKLDEQLRKQHQQFQVEKWKHLRGQFALHEFLAKEEEAMITLTRALNLDPDLNEGAAAPRNEPEQEKGTKNTEEKGQSV